jgi:hypothetical protein
VETFRDLTGWYSMTLLSWIMGDRKDDDDDVSRECRVEEGNAFEEIAGNENK